MKGLLASDLSKDQSRQTHEDSQGKWRRAGRKSHTTAEETAPMKSRH